jgi:hypothetical protein
LPNNAGALAGVTRLLADAHVNVLALSVDTSGHLRMVVDNHVQGAAALRERRHQVTMREVLWVSVPNSPGALAGPLRLVAEAGVNIDYAYSGATGANATASVVVAVEDAMRASAATGI